MTSVATVNTRRGKATPSPVADVIGHQEAKTPQARRRIRQVLHDYDHYTASENWAASLMVSWRADLYDVVPAAEWVPDVFGPKTSANVTVDGRGISWLVVDPIAGVTPGRGWVLVLLREKATGALRFILNGHPIPKAWSKAIVVPIRHNGKWVGGKAWRREQWTRQFELADRITRAILAAGRAMVAMADWNRPEVTLSGLVNPRKTKPRGIQAYDQILATPDLDPRRFRKAGPKAGSDHYPRAIDIGPKEAPVPDDLTINQRFYRALKNDPTVPGVFRRDEWGSKPNGRAWPLAPDVSDVYQWRRKNKPHSLLPDDPSDTLVQHVTVTTDDGPTQGDFFADMQELERIGFARFGSGVSYNVVVDQDGMVGIGMPLDAKGTHTVNDKGVPGFSYDQNKVALAVAWVAQPGDSLTQACKTSIAAVIRALRSAGALTRGFDYVPHSLFAAKACPLQNMRDAMSGIRAAGTDTKPDPEPPPPVEDKPTRVSNGRLLVEQGIELIGQTPDDRKRAQALAQALQAVLDDPGYPTR